MIIPWVLGLIPSALYKFTHTVRNVHDSNAHWCTAFQVQHVYMFCLDCNRPSCWKDKGTPRSKHGITLEKPYKGPASFIRRTMLSGEIDLINHPKD